jgi:arabinofuranosyltransferase
VPAARRDDLVVVAAALLPVGLFVLRERALAGVPGFPLDDSWIHLHFARNIAEGAGFAYNPGVPMAGSTAPLWTLLLALGATLVGASVGLAKSLGIAATILTALILRRAALAFGASSPVALVAAVGLLWSRPMTWGALSGMEVSLAALLVAGALLAHARGHAALTAVLAALAVLARPEAALLVPLLVLAGPLTLRRVATFSLITAAFLAPAVWFSMATVGAPFPATAAAKIEGGLFGWLAGVHESPALTWIIRPWRFAVAWGQWLALTHWLLPLALVPGLVAVALRAGRRLAVPALALAAHPLAMALLAPYRDPGFQEGRYSIHLLPVAMLVLAVGLSPSREKIRRTVLLAYLVIALITLPAAAERYGWAVQNINGMQVHLGRWVDGHVPRSARLAVNDIGAIAYFSRRPVIDLMGLVTPEIVPYRRQGERGIIRYVEQTCPDYVIVFPAWFPALVARSDLLSEIYRVRLDHNEVSGAAEMVVYRLSRCAV